MNDNIEKVSGVGGVFFRAQDPKGLSDWYRDNLGVAAEDGHASFFWREHDKPDTVARTEWCVFPADTTYFGSSKQAFMINYRVANLDRMLDQLRRKGVTIH